MTFKSDVFHVEYRNISEDNYLHVINIDQIDYKLKLFIDKNIVKICEGSSDSDCESIKKRLKSFFATKNGTTTEMGAIAEFFIHLYLNDCGFKQECLFLNLEENSIKKGFDGYYSFRNDEWVVESKSGKSSSPDTTHKNKINEAYKDLSDKFSGIGGNNPWRNAYNHASHSDVNSSSNIRSNIKKLSDEYGKEIFHNIKDFNIIPSSTIFLEDSWKFIDVDQLESKIRELIVKFQFKKIHIICVNKKSLSLFLNYLSS